MEEEATVKEELKAADELLSDATSKLHDALSVPAVNKQSVNVAIMMLDAAKTKPSNGKLRENRKKEKTIDCQAAQTFRKSHVNKCFPPKEQSN